MLALLAWAEWIINLIPDRIEPFTMVRSKIKNVQPAPAGCTFFYEVILPMNLRSFPFRNNSYIVHHPHLILLIEFSRPSTITLLG